MSSNGVRRQVGQIKRAATLSAVAEGSAQDGEGGQGEGRHHVRPAVTDATAL